MRRRRPSNIRLTREPLASRVEAFVKPFFITKIYLAFITEFIVDIQFEGILFLIEYFVPL